MRGLDCIAVGVLPLAVMVGCTSLRSESDTAGSVGAPLGEWACLQQAPAALPNPIPQAVYTTNVQSWLGGNALPDLLICVCDPLDSYTGPNGVPIPCPNPLAPTGCIQPNKSRTPSVTVDIKLPGTDSFVLEFFSPSADPLNPTVPDVLFFNHAPTKALVGEPAIRLIPFLIAQGIAGNFHFTLDPTLGIVLLRVFDCTGVPAPNVVFTTIPAPDGIIPFAYVNGNPTNQSLTTDSSGQFGFANFPPGSTLATAYLVNGAPTNAQLLLIAEGKMAPPADFVKLGDVNFITRASWATLADFRPFQP